MKPLPTDPMALQRRSITALCEDLFDIGSGRSTSFQRTDALLQVVRESKKEERR